jgi:crotonobetainyl-CoA:carnitine CoA-transferase CaiB-like acyl-CoA transferase
VTVEEGTAVRLPLSGLRVLELANEIAGPYAGKLFSDAGADVVKVEAATGDPLRRWTASGTVPDGDSALFHFLNTSKRSVVMVSPGDQAVRLAAGADIVLADDSVDEGLLDELREACAGVVVSITPYGRTGPSAGDAATEFTLQARCGSTAGRGLPETHPLAAGGRLGEFIGGTFAAVAGLAYALGARQSGRRQFIDLSLLEAMVITMGGLSSVSAQVLGNAAPAGRSLELPSIEPTADGYVGFCTVTGQQFQDFLLLIERFDWLDDAELASFAGRQRRRHEFSAAVREWTTKRTTADIIEAASALRIPVAPIGSPETIPAIDHFVERGVFITNPAGFHQPRSPYRIHGGTSRPLTPAPRLGEHDGAIDWPATTGVVAVASPTADLPLAGVRLFDLTAFWAGPSATHVLAALGADVIKVEGVKRPDGMRYAGGWAPSRECWWESGSVFLAVNENKRDLTLELTSPEGVALALQLIAKCDVVIENFSPRVMDNLGLTWEAVSAANPAAVMVRMPAFGLDGPWRDRVGFAQTMEQVSGMAWLTGDADGAPIIPRGACDPIAGLHAAFATLIALEQRRSSASGALVEVAMVEAALNAAAPVVIEKAAYGRALNRNGNRGPVSSPQGLYRCFGDDEWVALATSTDEQWAALCTAVGDGSLTDAAGHDSFAARQAAADRIDAVLAAWASARRAPDAAAELQRAGVPAAVVTAGRDLLDDPQLRHRQFFEPVDHPVVGRVLMPSQPLRCGDEDRRWLRTAAPTLGEHNSAILTSLLNVPADRLAKLFDGGVIGTRPAGL